METKEITWEKFEGYEEFDDYVCDYIAKTDAPHDCEGYLMMEDLYCRLYCLNLREESRDVRRSINKELLNDISEACLISVNPLLMILEAKHYSYYVTMVNYQVSCQFKSFLKIFDHPGDEPFADDGDLLCGGTIRHTEETLNDDYNRHLATKAIEIYNRYSKAAELKLVRLLSCTFVFDCACKWHMTILAVDEETGVSGTYQAALARRGEAYTLGLFRDVDADKILAILSIQGAERDMEDKMKLRAQIEEEKKKSKTQADERDELIARALEEGSMKLASYSAKPRFNCDPTIAVRKLCKALRQEVQSLLAVDP